MKFYEHPLSILGRRVSKLSILLLFLFYRSYKFRDRGAAPPSKVYQRYTLEGDLDPTLNLKY